MRLLRVVVCVFSVVTMSLGAGNASSQAYPGKPIRIVTVAPGSANDLVTRLISQELRAALGQAVIVDNRGGIAAEIVAKAPPDGYTLLFYGSAVWLAPFTRDNVPYDPLRDFAPRVFLGARISDCPALLADWRGAGPARALGSATPLPTAFRQRIFCAGQGLEAVDGRAENVQRLLEDHAHAVVQSF